jgi:hypothetical protein
MTTLTLRYLRQQRALIHCNVCLVAGPTKARSEYTKDFHIFISVVLLRVLLCGASF